MKLKNQNLIKDIVKLVVGLLGLIIGIGVISYVPSAEAREEIRIYAGAWSHHLTTDKNLYDSYKVYDYWLQREVTVTEKAGQFNETHNLAGVEYGKIFAGYFKNSFGDDSGFIGYNLAQYDIGNVRMKLLGGAVYGYRACLLAKPHTYTDYKMESKKVCPMIVPMVSYEGFKYVAPHVSLFGGAVAAGFIIKF